MIFRVRDLIITNAMNAFRGHLTKVGQIVPEGGTNAKNSGHRRGLENGFRTDFPPSNGVDCGAYACFGAGQDAGCLPA